MPTIRPYPEELACTGRCVVRRRRFRAGSRDTYLSAQYRRLKTRRGHRRAIGAVKHSIIVAAWHMLSTGEVYREAGGDYYTRINPNKQTRRLVAQLERLGHTVTLQERAAA